MTEQEKKLEERARALENRVRDLMKNPPRTIEACDYFPAVFWPFPWLVESLTGAYSEGVRDGLQKAVGEVLAALGAADPQLEIVRRLRAAIRKLAEGEKTDGTH